MIFYKIIGRNVSFLHKNFSIARRKTDNGFISAFLLNLFRSLIDNLISQFFFSSCFVIWLTNMLTNPLW
jgi:hypothetical protein